MSESAARAERFEAASSSPASYLWEIPGKPVSVRLNLELVENLEREVVENFRSLNSRGSEIGGVLLGTAAGSAPARISIERFELVSCDYTRGPLYRFSQADVERFDRAMETRHNSNGLRVVGFFRSHTRKGLCLDADDIAFFTAHFREPHQVALLIRPYASKASTAGIFIWENGTVQGDNSYREFPFRRHDLERSTANETAEPAPQASTASPAPAAPEPAPAKSPSRAQIVPIASRREISLPPPPEPVAAEPAPAPEPKAAAVERNTAPPKTPSAEKTLFTGKTVADEAKPERPESGTKAKSGKLTWIAGGSAVAIVLLGGMLIYPGLLHKPKRSGGIPGQDASGLTLRVERSQGELLLTWNRDSAAIRNAAGAVLSIADGEQHANINMDLAQLQNGSIVYSPTSSDVVFQLSITGKDSSKTQSESVRVLRTRPSPMPYNPPDKPGTAVNSPNAANPLNAANATPGAPGAVTTDTPELTENKPAPTPLKPFAAEAIMAQRLRPARPSDLPDAPGLGSAAPEPASIALPGANLAAPSPLAPPAPSSPAAPQSGTPGKVGGQILQAELISRTSPEYPQAARQARVQGGVTVVATVGTDGKIKSARAISGPPLLYPPAVAAVKQWVYRPAMLNGAPVESETRIELKFTLGR
ncbi:MAG: hypothetical protein C5B51_05025 [Terriglobia bacterium]|nr:MAG: hypothetical protein C5B51_05025 [Terriglobia bacterium]